MEGCEHSRVITFWFKVIGLPRGRQLGSSVFLWLLSGPLHRSFLSRFCCLLSICSFTRTKVLLNSPIIQHWDKETHRVIMVRSGKAVPTAFTLSVRWPSSFPNSQGKQLCPLDQSLKFEIWPHFLKIEINLADMVLETHPSWPIDSLWRWRHQQPSHLQQDMSKSSMNGGRHRKLSSGLGTNIQNVPQSLVPALV